MVIKHENYPESVNYSFMRFDHEFYLLRIDKIKIVTERTLNGVYSIIAWILF